MPRELLWAIIGALAITVIALFPSHYPYSQAPKVDPQQEPAKGIGGGNEAQHGPTGLKDSTGDENKRDGSKHAADAEIWGVKRGEGLLFLATLGLWYATWRLVRGAEETAKRQLRAYVSATRVETTISVNPRGELDSPVVVVLKNSGQTPAVLMGVSIEACVQGAGPASGKTNPHYREIAPGMELESRGQIGVTWDTLPVDSERNERYGFLIVIVRFRYRDYLGEETRRGVEFRGWLRFQSPIIEPIKIPLELLGSVEDNGIWDEPQHPATRKSLDGKQS